MQAKAKPFGGRRCQSVGWRLRALAVTATGCARYNGGDAEVGGRGSGH